MFRDHVGFPSSPSLTVVAGNLQQIIFVISPPSYAGQCVVNYTITATSSDGSVVPDITVEVIEGGGPVVTTGSGFNACNTTYSFTVVAQTLTYTGEVSAAVNSVPVSSFSKLFCAIVLILL